MRTKSSCKKEETIRRPFLFFSRWGKIATASTATILIDQFHAFVYLNKLPSLQKVFLYTLTSLAESQFHLA